MRPSDVIAVFYRHLLRYPHISVSADNVEHMCQTTGLLTTEHQPPFGNPASTRRLTPDTFVPDLSDFSQGEPGVLPLAELLRRHP